jgi:hypothetical protein
LLLVIFFSALGIQVCFFLHRISVSYDSMALFSSCYSSGLGCCFYCLVCIVMLLSARWKFFFFKNRVKIRRMKSAYILSYK